MPVPFDPPDVLVLASGGVLGEAWMSGLLAGIEDATGHDFRRTESLVGTSAGALVAAALVAGQRPRRPDSEEDRAELHPGGGDRLAEETEARIGAAWRAAPRDLMSTVAREAVRWAGAATAPLAPAALAVGAPGGAALRAALLARAPGQDGSLREVRDRVTASGARFDGRLRVVAVERETGKRVVFGAPGAPAATVGEAVQASCSVPWIFAPAPIGGLQYVDGGVWSSTNLDVAPAGRDTRVLCLNPVASLELALASPFGILRAISGAAVALELLSLRSRGAQVRMLGPDRDCAKAIGPDLMSRHRRDGVLRSAYAQGLVIGRG